MGSSKNQHRWWFPSALMFLGVVLAVAGSAGLLKDDRLDHFGITTTATVVKYHQSKPSTRYVDDITVEFTTRAGERVRTSTRRFYNEHTTVGRQVEIKYDPEKPESVQVANWRRDPSMQWILLGLGVATAVFGLLVAVRTVLLRRS